MSTPYTPPAPSREYNQKRMVDIVRIGHDTLDKEHEKLQEAVLGIYKFQAIPTPPESKKVYQYEIENQEEYVYNVCWCWLNWFVVESNVCFCFNHWYR